MTKTRKIELLAPAKNLECGIEAINHGADAIYIGAPKFGARAAAGNSLDDIKELISHAHQFGVKVYVALNTILNDKELKESETIIWQLYEANADALIIQDMGIMMLNLPPIPLHASTQTDNRSSDKVKFLEESGFSQIVLARELTFQEIKSISESTTVTLEAFIHGALCVCYSGQCYLSEAIAKRSANRGECAQFCRLPYDLIDSEGEEIIRKKHLLSMKDLNLSDNLEELLNAGVNSLKIEGRLKDITYVKNVVAYYRQKLDRIIEKYPDYIRASSGKSSYTFEPDLQKSFNRGYTKYFFNGRPSDIWSIDSPKSIGEPIGEVKNISDRYFVVSGNKKLNNGDGLCFLNEKNELQGMRVNRIDGEKIFTSENQASIKKGTFIYRNFNHEFEKILNKKSAERKIDAKIKLQDTPFGFLLKIEDEDGITASIEFECKKEEALKDQSDNIKNNLQKTGNTIFNINDVTLKFSANWFIPASIISNLRRQLTDKLLDNRIKSHSVEKIEHKQTSHPFPVKNISYLGNVMNDQSKQFYVQHQSTVVEAAFEKKAQNGVPLMFTRHCIKYSMGWCPKETKEQLPYKEPFYLLYNDTRLRLEFDCKNCDMKVYKE